MKMTGDIRELRVELKKVEADRDRLDEQFKLADRDREKLEGRLAQIEVELQEAVHARLAAESARNVAQDALAKAEVARHKAAEEAITAARARDQAGTAGDDAKRELDRLKKKIAELESKAAAPTTGPDPAALAADLDKEKRASKDAADKAAAAERQLKSLQAELEAAKTDAQKARAEAERAKAAAANVEATTVSAAPAALAASGEIQQKAREVYDAINDVLSEIRNNAMLVQGEVDNLGGGGGDAARIIKDTVEALMGNAEDAKGALRGLKDLAES
jgi:chromosome segregation ATPase